MYASVGKSKTNSPLSCLLTSGAHCVARDEPVFNPWILKISKTKWQLLKLCISNWSLRFCRFICLVSCSRFVLQLCKCPSRQICTFSALALMWLISMGVCPVSFSLIACLLCRLQTLNTIMKQSRVPSVPGVSKSNAVIWSGPIKTSSYWTTTINNFWWHPFKTC